MYKSDALNNNPKITMLFEWLDHHYPDDMEAICKNKLVVAMLQNSQYSNSEIEAAIDKIAILNNWQKWDKVNIV